MSPYLWGVVAGGLLGYLIERNRPGANSVVVSPKLPKGIRQKGRLKLPGEERRIGGR